jgi:hypothetical protein
MPSHGACLTQAIGGKSESARPAVDVGERKEADMQDTRELFEESRALAWTALVYYAVMLAAFLIGLYGFFTLIWLAGDSVAQNMQAFGFLL